MTSEKREQKFHTDDVSLPILGKCLWLIEAHFPHGKTNQKHYPDLGTDASSVWNFCTCFSNVALQGKPVVKSQNVSCFLRLSLLFILFFYFICHTIITKNIGKEEKKKWRGDQTETIGAYERLGLLEIWARAVSHQLKKRRRKVEDGKIYELFSYLLNNLIFSFFLKEERDWELMTLLSSELKTLELLRVCTTIR